ncbi:MAG TPA: bifunctional phosphoglucose/phosphomannose isomerase [Bacteroidia bacterium]|nr:bifunctional phosphoglucose/phosphomannose isomerase [Bacteroidia bacterium]HNT79525.1 bifunctional phosphoglucose/phosphomannose isomerase [Bacteroidia bacterium]
MNELIDSFSKQLSEAFTIGSKATFSNPKKEIQNVFISGLGGSGIGGTIVTQLTEGEIKVPITVGKDYFIPAWVNENTLMIISSYSGNTEETLQAMASGINQKAQIVCISSGGKVIDIAKENGYDHIIIPGGNPPRACLAYSLTQLLFVLNGYHLIGDSFKSSLKASINLIESEFNHIKEESKNIASGLKGKIPVIYCTAPYEGTAIRLRQQINENSKMLCWHHALPEMNHNELVGWTESQPNVAVLMFKAEDDFDRTQVRMNLTKGVIQKFAPVFEVNAKGSDRLQRMIYFIHWGDQLSWHLSELQQCDAMEVNVIDFLKGELSKV